MNFRHAIIAAILVLVLPLFARAQSQDEPGRVWGDYTVHSSVEFGGHIADSEGSQTMYQSLVDVNSGPRLLEQELTMRSNTRVGGFFDNLYTSSFGFGGDPNGMARLRMEKHHWYNFVAVYRRDKNVFDYDLFGNPLNLNPGITTCGAGCSNAFTPSALPWFSNTTRTQWVTRNMGDFSLTLLPQSKVSVRLGYARNASYGAIGSTLEAPLRTLLLEDSQWKSDRYQFGVDLKMLPRTTISADFFWEHDKNDIGFTDASNLLYTMGNATGQQLTFNGAPLSVDTGLLYPPLSGTLASCAGANKQSIFTGNIFLLNSGCNGLLVNSGVGGSYFRTGNVRTNIPTGQLSLQSNYFRNLDLSASATYSSASSDFLNYNEFAHLNSNQPGAPTPPATISTSNSNLFLINAAPTADRISANADLGMTYHISKSLSVSDKFRWLNWREPGVIAQNQYGCFLPTGAAFATAAGTTGTFTSLLNPCNSAILSLINPAGGAPLIGTAGSVTNGRGNYQQVTGIDTIVGERSYFNTFKVNWQPNRRFTGYIGYRFARRSFQDGNADITGILGEVTANFVNNGTGLAPTVPQCNVSTAGCDPTTGIITNLGGVDSEQINQHTLLFGTVVRPVEAWRINADVEFSTADNAFTLIYPRHQQRVRAYTTYKAKPWLSFNGGFHIVDTRNNFAASTVQDDNGASPGNPLFPASFIPLYGHKDHWRYYTLGTTVTKSRFTLDAGWTLQDQNINSATCMPVPANAFTGGLTAPAACNNGATARALLLSYQESTHTGYTDISFQPVKRVTVSLGYALTSDSGYTKWLRADNGQPLQVVGDIYGNSPVLAGNPITPCPGASNATGCIFPGPFPDQPLGPQAINWTNAHAGIAVEVVRGVQFKGFWNYYDYNSKDHPPSLANLQVTAPRDFHANVGTVSLRYSF